MKIVFLGCTKFSEYLLKSLLSNHFDVVAVFTIPRHFTVGSASEQLTNVNYVDLEGLTKAHNIPIYYVDQKNNLSSCVDLLREIQPDIILVLGWYYLVPKVIREIPKYGVCGIHASLLPKYAGWSPLTWAIIHGEKESGVTFFQFDDSVDGGDIIAQRNFLITQEDNIESVYEKAMLASSEILKNALPIIDKITFVKQDKSKLEVYGRRTPEDGEIDFSQPAQAIYDFVRAQSSPYPGAFFKTVDGKKIIIEKARIEE